MYMVVHLKVKFTPSAMNACYSSFLVSLFFCRKWHVTCVVMCLNCQLNSLFVIALSCYFITSYIFPSRQQKYPCIKFHSLNNNDKGVNFRYGIWQHCSAYRLFLIIPMLLCPCCAGINFYYLALWIKQ
jgi:hypothetical protein